MLTLILIELAAMEERTQLWSSHANGVHDWRNEDCVRDRELRGSHALRGVIYSSGSPDRRATAALCRDRLREPNRSEDMGQEASLPDVTASDPHRNPVEHQRAEQLRPVHGCESLPGTWLGCFRHLGNGLDPRYLLCKPCHISQHFGGASTNNHRNTSVVAESQYSPSFP